MSWDIEGRKAFIAYSFGVCVTKDKHYIDHEEVRLKIDQDLVRMNQPPLTKDEEEIFDLIDNIMYLFRLQTSNRKGFRNWSRKNPQ